MKVMTTENMMRDKIYRDNIAFEYERDDFGSYLAVKVKDSCKIINYQVEMLTNNEIPGLLPVIIRKKENETYLYYNITSKISLLQLLSRIRITKEKYINIMQQISKTILTGRNFLLYGKCFLIDENYIYINPETNDIYLLYLPISGNILIDEDIEPALRNFVIRMMVNFVEIDEECSGDSYIQKLLSHTKKDTFNVENFNRFLNRLANEGAYPLNMELNASNEESDVLNEESNELKNVSEEERKKTNILASFARIFKNIFRSGSKPVCAQNTDDTSSANENGSSIKDENDNAMGSYDDGDITDYCGNTVLLTQVKQSRAFLKKIPESRIKRVEDITDTDMNIEMANDVIYGDMDMEIINIDKCDFLIGRLQSHVDYVIKNNAVGKIHAQIISRDDKYYIKDLNSKNGTYINEERIVSNTEYEIKSGDRITFANSQYVFIKE